MPKISACLMSYNEEARIEDCLRSLRAVADEIVVVDSYSTDRTAEIAEQYADRVILNEFAGHVTQRNFAVTAASHDWVLTIDCDERLSPELQSEILAAKPNLGRVPAYTMPRRNFYIDRWIDHAWYPDRGICFFDRRRGRSSGTEPHDSLVIDSGKPGHFKGNILHYTCDSVSKHMDTINHYSSLAAKDMFAKGRKTYALEGTLRSIVTFTRLYVFKRGFLDGFSGLVVSVLSATETFVRYTKLRYLHKGYPITKSH